MRDVKLFISPRSAHRAARAALKPGWSFDIVRRQVWNRDRTLDVAFGARLFDQHGLYAGMLR